MFARNRTEEQSEHADFDHFCNQFDLLALSVSVLCAAVSCFSFNNEKCFENKNMFLITKKCFGNKNIKLRAYWNTSNCMYLQTNILEINI